MLFRPMLRKSAAIELAFKEMERQAHENSDIVLYKTEGITTNASYLSCSCDASLLK